MVRKPGRPPSTSRLAALKVAENMDLSKLTIAMLAEEMGVSRTTLYGYFMNDEDLLSAAIKRSWSNLVWPDPHDFADWKSYLYQVVAKIWDHVERHPGLAIAMGSTRQDSSPLVPVDPEMVTALMDFGLTPDHSLLALDVLSDLTSQAFFRDRVLDQPVDSSVGAEKQRVKQLRIFVDRLPIAARESYLAAIGGPSRKWFDRKLYVILDGLEVTFARS